MEVAGEGKPGVQHLCEIHHGAMQTWLKRGVNTSNHPNTMGTIMITSRFVWRKIISGNKAKYAEIAKSNDHNFVLA